MYDNSQVVNTVKNLCREQNVSLSELSRRVGIAKSSISRYFRETRKFPYNKAKIFSDALYTTPEFILGIENDKSTNIELNNIFKDDVETTYNGKKLTNVDKMLIQRILDNKE